MTLDELEQMILDRCDDTALGVFIIDRFEQYRRSQNSGKPLVSGSVVPASAGLVVGAEWCPKCSPNTWGNQIAQVYPEVQICAKCGYEHKRHIEGTTDH